MYKTPADFINLESAVLCIIMRDTTLIVLIVSLGLLFTAYSALAAYSLQTGLDTAAKEGGLKSQGKTLSVAEVVGKILGIILPFLGIVFLVLVIYAGIMWMTAGGKPDTTKKAKDIIISAAIGLAITLMAYQISKYIFEKIYFIQMTG